MQEMRIQDYKDMLKIAVDSLTMIAMNEVDSPIEESLQAITDILDIKKGVSNGGRCDKTRN